MKFPTHSIAHLACSIGIFILTTTSADANVISVDTQNFNPTYNGLDFVTVQSSETLEPGIFNLGLFVNYAVNTLPFYRTSTSDAKNTRFGKVRDEIVSTDLSFGLGLTSFWDVGLSIPFMVHQNVHTKSDARGEYADAGMTEVRAATKLRVLGNRRQGLGVVLTTNFNMIDNNPFVGEGGGPIYSAELVGDTVIMSRVALGLNLGYRKRNPGKQNPDFPIEPTKDQYIASTAASLLFPRIHSKLIAEIFGSIPVAEASSAVARRQSSAEAILGFKHDVTSQFALHAGVGSELNHSYASPDWRVYIGTNVAMGPLWGDRDVVEKKVKKVAQKPQLPPATRTEQVATEDNGGNALVPLVAGEEYPSDADETFVLRDIYFAFDSDYRALPGAKEMLGKIATRIQNRRFKKMLIEGHTDYLGTYEYNIELGSRRANTIRTYLIKQFNLDANKLFIESYGETRPIGDNGNFQGRQLNRRVVFRIYY